jgi:heme iron utilization protein
MDQHKQPDAGRGRDASASDARREKPAQESLRDLLQQQLFAVLCTQGAGQPYGSVVAYAINDSLDAVVFATARATRKYDLLTHCDRVALVIDSRSVYPNQLMKVEAITATGRVVELAGAERAAWSRLLTVRHPQLSAFVDDLATAVFKVEIARYLYVTRFQETHSWVPGAAETAG